MNELIIETAVDNDQIILTGLSHDEIGDEHIMTGIETPMVKDAFVKSDTEKKEIIAFHFKKIMETMGLDLTDDSLKGTPERVAKIYR
jgi:GTP cyclohydrolase I